VPQRLKDIGESVNIDFTGKCDILPNPTKGHVLMEYAREVGGGQKQDELQELMFKAYFTDGPPDGLWQTDFLLQCVEKVGLDKSKAQALLNDPAQLQSVRDIAQEWRNKGVKSSPTFFMNGKQMFAGYVEVDAFIKGFEEAANIKP